MTTNNKSNYLISATGAHGLVVSHHDSVLKKTLQASYLNLPDGMPLVWVGKLKGAKRMERCYGPDFFRSTIISTRDKDVKHFLCGGKEDVPEELKRVCEEKFGNNNIVGTYSPPFREMSDEEIKGLAYNINSLNTDVIWIGLSTPKQEIFANRLSKFTDVHFLCTVGAAFDFHTGKLKEAPRWVQNMGIEWLFRLIIEPKRLWKRYFTVVPLFIWYNLIEILKGEFFQNTVEVHNGK